ncbi:MAG: threonine/serine exporter family protein [Cellulosilyticaceae bacterium]
MKTNYNHEDILTFAVRVGEIMLKSGAETYRVEDTIVRLLSSHHFTKVDTFVTPTGITTTIGSDTIPLCTTVCRVKNRSTRLDKIEYINQLSRDYVCGSLDLGDAIRRLDEIDQTPAYLDKTIVLTTGIAAASFSLMFGAHLLEFVIALFTGITVALLQIRLRKKEIISYFILFLSAMFIGAVVVVSSFIFADKVNIESIVIGGVMPLVPGVAFTNAVRDTIGDELLSGMSRGVEALFIAVAIAAGVGVSMSIGLFLGGIF